MELLILYLPLGSAILTGLGGQFFDKYSSAIFSITSIFFSFLFSWILFFNSLETLDIVYFNLGSWIKVGVLNISWGFMFDPLAITMLVVVTTISLCVQLYSWGYMYSDPSTRRFYSYLSLFTFFMLLLVTSDNYVLLFTGWEGIGLCSYLLINFWFTRLQANKAGLKALIVNRVGDVGFLVGISAIFNVFGTLNFLVLFPLIPFYADITFNFFFFGDINVITFICFFLMIGAVGKSAQIGLHIWLPDAMEGPTPVSALIHAATLVTAGIFLIIRSSPFFEYSETILNLLLILGSLTSFFSSLIALVQNDIKKIIAYSTCSQLGYMMFACGLSTYTASLFHLFNHAFFKALLFLSAGSVIHALSGEQDIRKMGALSKLLPFTYTCMLIGSLALAGFPFLSGFYSKDVIIEASLTEPSSFLFFCQQLGIIVTFFTGFYSFRLIYYVFWSSPRMYKKVVPFIHEPSFFMAIPMFFLGILSIFSGFFFKDVFVGLGSNFFDFSIFVKPEHEKLVNVIFLNTFITLIPVFFSFLGCVLAFVLNHYQFFSLKTYYLSQGSGINFYRFFNEACYIDYVYNTWSHLILYLGYWGSFFSLDKGFFEWFGPTGISYTLSLLPSKFLSIAQNGCLSYYLFYSAILVPIFFSLIDLLSSTF